VKRYTTLFVLLFIHQMMMLCLCSNANALAKPTHQAITSYVAQHEVCGFSLNSFLRAQLGLPDGVMQPLAANPEYGEGNMLVIDWLIHGAKKEDEPLMRSFRHFHNPLSSWSEAGLSNSRLGSSSVLWAQYREQVYGKYCWQDVRNYYGLALTGVDQETREHFFVETFRGLGQLMHLIQDASVPLHTRDDPHVIFNYEDWIDRFSAGPEASRFLGWLGDNNNYGYNRSLFYQTPEDNGREDFWYPFATLFDSDQYMGENPEITISSVIGLAEYSNANFLSRDKMFGAFPHPSWEDVHIGVCEIEDPRDPSRTVARQYYIQARDNYVVSSNVGDHNGYCLATVGFLRDYVASYFSEWGQILRAYESPGLDSKVYEDYAKRLIPRAVGYSAAVLDYFFRGRLEVDALPYIIEYDGQSCVHGIRVKIRNVTPTQEPMTGGTFALLVQYTNVGRGTSPEHGDTYLQLNDVWGNLYIPCDRLEANGGDQIELEFYTPIPASSGDPHVPIPIDYYDSIKCWLVYRGQLGTEHDAVIGKAFTLGEIKFNEDWTDGFTGTHAWAHTDINRFNQNPDNGVSANRIEVLYNPLFPEYQVLNASSLVKENIRYDSYSSYRGNQSIVGDAFDGEYMDIFPIVITPQSYLQLRIDEMSLTGVTHSAFTDTQFFRLNFNNGYNIVYTRSGQLSSWNSTTARYDIGGPPGSYLVTNIYDSLLASNIVPPEPLILEGIEFRQYFFDLQEQSETEHRQRMTIDYVRIIEESTR